MTSAGKEYGRYYAVWKIGRKSKKKIGSILDLRKVRQFDMDCLLDID